MVIDEEFGSGIFTGTRFVKFPKKLYKFLEGLAYSAYKEARDFFYYIDEAGYSDAQAYVAAQIANRVEITEIENGFLIVVAPIDYDERMKKILSVASQEGLVADGNNVINDGKIIATFNPEENYIHLCPMFNSLRGTINFMNLDEFNVPQNLLDGIKERNGENYFSNFLRYLGQLKKTHAEVYAIIDGASKNSDFFDFYDVPDLYDVILECSKIFTNLVVDGNNVLKNGEIIKTFSFNENLKHD